MKTFKEFCQESYITQDLVRRMRQMKNQGLNPDNPDRMNTNLNFKDTVHQMTPKPIERTLRQFVPHEPSPKVNKPRSREFGHGRSLKSLIGTSGEA